MSMVTLRDGESRLCGSFFVRADVAPYYWPCEKCKKCGMKILGQGQTRSFPMSGCWWFSFTDCEECDGKGFIRRKERNPDYVEPVEQELAAST